MKSVKYRVEGKKFIIENYHNSRAFSSFLPGIAGMWGKPMWVFYVNRGQAITCFGVKDKDGAILEFIAANKAYRQTGMQGFRTFLKANGNFYEPFQNNYSGKVVYQEMHIQSDRISILDNNKKLGLSSQVEYFTLPSEKFPALMRKLTITNSTSKQVELECIDGLPSIVPYGTNNDMLKNVSRLAEGWYNGVFFTEKMKVPVYKLPVEPRDTPEIIPVRSAHFYLGYYKSGRKIVQPEYIIDPNNLFGEIYDFSNPVIFRNSDKFTINPELTGKNKTPSGMGYMKIKLAPGQEFTYYSSVAHAHNSGDIDSFAKILFSEAYFEDKLEQNYDTVSSVTNDMLTVSSMESFDNYCEQIYLDNVLRGGYPVRLGKGENKTHYSIYSRIHGDMEREYNNFVILPEYFSQGNGSYRDVNQNRRSDIFFNPELAEDSIIMFMNLIQLDGFNPLRIMGSRFSVKDVSLLLGVFKEKDREDISLFAADPFTLGAFYNYMEDKKIKPLVSNKKLLELIVDNSDKIEKAAHAEGYWSDHWHYNIDLIESFLSIYPERLGELMLDRRSFTFYDNPNIVVSRKHKYVLFDGKPKQLDAVYRSWDKEEQIARRKKNRNAVRAKNGKGSIYRTTLIVKLLSLLFNKYASLDPEGIGVEMESNKPNWCDALNGLPGIFGSSTAESLELKRLIRFVISFIDSDDKLQDESIALPEEVYELMASLEHLTVTYSKQLFNFWDKSHKSLENFRRKTLMGISGKETKIKLKALKAVLEVFLDKVNSGIEKAIDEKTGLIYTNIEYIPTKYSIVKEKGKEKKNVAGNTCIKVSKFKKNIFPEFLEGPVHCMRTGLGKAESKRLHKAVMRSGLYDKKLKMLKCNASLKDVDYSIGRITVFTPGWLENESIWTHMEYKYMYELIRTGLYRDFFKLSETALVPFMDPKVYGRSIFENSSFLVSSAHPEKNIVGRGYVARLTGSTAEFISIWIAITSGMRPFRYNSGRLELCLRPVLPGSWFTEDPSEICCYSKDAKKNICNVPADTFSYKFLGNTLVVYHNPSRGDTFGSSAVSAKKTILTYKSGKKYEIEGSVISEPHSKNVRAGKVDRLDIFFA